MKRKFGMLVLGLAVLGLPDASRAADGLGGTLTLGGGFIDARPESFKLGEYNGLYKDKAFLVGGADLSYGQGAYYLDFRAYDIGLDKRRAYAEAGRLGAYRLFVEYSETPKLISNSSATVLDGAGSTNLTLPGGFTRGTNTSLAQMPDLADNRRSVRLRLDRKSAKAGFYRTSGATEVELTVARERKEGIKFIGGTSGYSGGQTRSVGLPEPVDYTTDVLRLRAAHTKEAFQAEFQYALSDFSNGDRSLTFANPFDVDAGGGVLYDYCDECRVSLPPDNRHHRLSLSGGLNLPYHSRLSATLEYGIMEQDENLLPYSHNSGSTVTVDVPKGRADAEIDVTHLALNLSSRPVAGLGLRAGYRLYKTENKLSRTLFRYVKNDTAQPQAALTEAHALYSLPYDYTQNQFKLDGTYSVLPATTLRLGYVRDVINRDYREVERTAEDSYKVSVSTAYVPNLSVGLDYMQADRRGTDYDESHLYDKYHTQEYMDDVVATLGADALFDNHPLMRKFDVASRDRLRYGANATLTPTHNSSLSLFVNYGKDDYKDSAVGLRQSKTSSVTLDGAIAPSENASVYAFYTWEDLKARQGGWAYNGGGSKLAHSADADRKWTASHDDDIETWGFGAKLSFLEKKADLDVDYSFSRSSGSIRHTAGSDISSSVIPTDLPELRTRLKTLSVTGKYRLRANLSVGAGYRYDDFESDDWGNDNFEPSSTAVTNVLTLVGPVSDYEAHTGMVFLTYSL